MKWPWSYHRRKLHETQEQLQDAASDAMQAQRRLMERADRDRQRSRDAARALLRMGEQAMRTMRQLEEHRR